MEWVITTPYEKVGLPRSLDVIDNRCDGTICMMGDRCSHKKYIRAIREELCCVTHYPTKLISFWTLFPPGNLRWHRTPIHLNSNIASIPVTTRRGHVDRSCTPTWRLHNISLSDRPGLETHGTISLKFGPVKCLTLSVPRVINLQFPLQPLQKYYITQYGELGFS